MCKRCGHCRCLVFFPARVNSFFLENSSTERVAFIVPGFLKEAPMELVPWVGPCSLSSVSCVQGHQGWPMLPGSCSLKVDLFL